MQQPDKRRYSVRAFLVAGVIGAITLLGSQQGLPPVPVRQMWSF